MANTNKVKNLTLSELKKQSKKLDSQSEVVIIAGEDNYKFMVDDVFRKTKQHKVLDDMVEFFDSTINNNELMSLASVYTSILLIKHFTSIDISDNIDEALETLNVLLDLELLDKIINAMPEDEVVKMYELLTNTVNKMTENLEELDIEALAEQVENPELKEALLNGESE